MFVAPAAEDAFQMNAEQAAELLDQLVALPLIEPVEPKTVLAESGLDVDIAIELMPKFAEKAEFRKWCDRRRYAARVQGKSFRSSFDWIFWSRGRFLKRFGRGRVLSACTEFMTLPR
jgi:hypothetical protein